MITHKQASKQYYAIDVAKLIFALAVVAIHIDPMFEFKGTSVYKMYQSFIYIAVPFFFITSGFLMAERIVMFEKKKDELYFLKNQIQKYVKIYLMWNIVYAPLAVWHYLHTKTVPKEIVRSVLLGLFWTGENWNSWILWYLLSSIYSLTYIFMMRKMQRSYKEIFFGGMIIALCAVFLVDYRHKLIICSGVLGLLLEKASNLGARVVTGFFYIPLGMNLGIALATKERTIPKAMSCVFLIGGLIIIILSSGYGLLYEIGRVVASLSIVAILIDIQLEPSKKYMICRGLSSSLYYWHLWVYTILCFMMYGMGNMHKGLGLYLGTVGIIILCYCVTKQRGHLALNLLCGHDV